MHFERLLMTSITPHPTALKPRYTWARDNIRKAGKGKVGTPAYLRFINRPIGGWFACVGFALKLTPNIVTMLSALVSFVAIGMIALMEPTVPVAFAIAFLLLLGFALDSADGQLARLQGGGKPSGEWLDHVVDIAKISSLHLAVMVSLYRFGEIDHDVWLLVPAFFLVVNVTYYFSMMLKDKIVALSRHLQEPEPAPSAAQTGSDAAKPSGLSHGSVGRSMLLLPADYGVQCIIFVLLFRTQWFLIAYSTLCVCITLFAAQSWAKAYRTLS